MRPLGILVHSANAVEEKTKIAAAQVSNLSILTPVSGGYLQGLRYRLVVIDPRWAEARHFRSAAHEAMALASSLRLTFNSLLAESGQRPLLRMLNGHCQAHRPGPR